MANDLNKGAERLTARILEDARAEAAKSAQAAEAEANRIKELAAAEAEKVRAGYKTQAESTARDILERSRTNAQLDAIKFALTAKRQVLDEAFKGALDKLNALDGDVRDGLIESLALRAAHGGEELCPSKADAERAARLLERINAALKEKGKAPLTIGEGADVDGGFLLRGKGYEMNCSFEAMLSDFRQAEESGVAKILFV